MNFLYMDQAKEKKRYSQNALSLKNIHAQNIKSQHLLDQAY